MSVGSAVELLLAFFAVGLLVRNIVGLCTVMSILSDSKAGRLLKVKAVIKRSVPSRRRGSSRATADYSIGERKLNGRMIGTSRERLTEGQTVKVFVSERKPGFFAVDERQIKSALSDYIIMCAMFFAIAAFLVFVFVTGLLWRTK